MTLTYILNNNNLLVCVKGELQDLVFCIAGYDDLDPTMSDI